MIYIAPWWNALFRRPRDEEREQWRQKEATDPFRLNSRD